MNILRRIGKWMMNKRWAIIGIIMMAVACIIFPISLYRFFSSPPGQPFPGVGLLGIAMLWLLGFAIYTGDKECKYEEAKV